MRHLSEGALRAYLDGALPAAQLKRLRGHLAHCDRCSASLVRIEARIQRIRVLVQPFVVHDEANSVVPPVSLQVARARLAKYEQDKEEVSVPMSTFRGFARRYSPAWVTLVLILVVGGSLVFAPVRAFASDLLGLFRVQKITVIEFSPSALFSEQGAEAAMKSLEQVMDEQATVTIQGEPQEVDETTLRSLSSMQVQLPQQVEGTARYGLQPAAQVSIQVDLPRIRALLTELGYEDVSLPDSLDGAHIDVQIAPMAVAAYGECAANTGAEGFPALAEEGAATDCTVLAQMRSPVISAPDTLDVQWLGQAYLQLLGMSADEAASFSARVDWTATLVVPLPRSEAQYENVTVDGVPGVLIRPTQRRLPQSQYLLMWVKGDIVYTLMGAGSATEAVEIAASLQ